MRMMVSVRRVRVEGRVGALSLKWLLAASEKSTEALGLFLYLLIYLYGRSGTCKAPESDGTCAKNQFACK